MGPAGSGKTTIGELLAAQLTWDFVDGDSFHAPASIEKMSRGMPLNDDDRQPWLNALRDEMLQWEARRQSVVLACSALKRRYRELLRISADVKIVYLKGNYELLRERLRSRKGHYAGEQLLASQFTELEEPADALTIDASRSPEEIVTQIRKQLALV